MKKFEVTLVGSTPLLLHNDNIRWGEKVKEWSKNPKNKGRSIPGDDRTPAWTWIGYVYVANKKIVVDCDNLMAMLRDAGKKVPANKGKGSMKAVTQSSMLVNEIGWPINVDGHTIDVSILESLYDEEDFEKHEKTVIENDFELFVKRAKINNSKHVRVRPKFESWSISGTITVLEDQYVKTLFDILEVAGKQIGLCDWRPGSNSPGHYGMFNYEIKEI